MLKVFLVEDEFVMREGIKNKIDWETHGYEFCGEASDGELAFPMIQKLKPDIVITDIKMPFMDGLELSRLIKKDMPWIEIILLSGYEEFSYAKEGIKIGIARYLTKPISGDELLNEVDIVAKTIEEKNKEREVLEKYNLEMEENNQQERKNLFQYLVMGDKSMSELFDLAEKLELDISALWYNIILIHIKPTNRLSEEYSTRMVEIDNRLRSLETDYPFILFDRNVEGKAMLIKADSLEELKERQNQLLEQIKEMVKPYTHIKYFGGIGKPVNRMRELPDSYEAAGHAMAHRYLVDESMFLDSENLGTDKGGEEDFDMSSLRPTHMDREQVREFLRCGDVDELSYFVEEFLQGHSNHPLQSKLFRQYITMDIYFCVMEFLDGLSIDKNEIEPLDMKQEVFQSEESAVSYVKEIMKYALICRQKAASNRYGDIVEEVLRYIAENYADDELSLNVLAEHVNFSPSYLSMIFSQETGQTFIKYLTDFRMSKAKELLRCTGKRSGEISVEVGYKDPHYFSYLFKKTQGMTPSKYRGTFEQGENE